MVHALRGDRDRTAHPYRPVVPAHRAHPARPAAGRRRHPAAAGPRRGRHQAQTRRHRNGQEGRTRLSRRGRCPRPARRTPRPRRRFRPRDGSRGRRGAGTAVAARAGEILAVSLLLTGATWVSWPPPSSCPRSCGSPPTACGRSSPPGCHCSAPRARAAWGGSSASTTGRWASRRTGSASTTASSTVRTRRCRPDACRPYGSSNRCCGGDAAGYRWTRRGGVLELRPRARRSARGRRVGDREGAARGDGAVHPVPAAAPGLVVRAAVVAGIRLAVTDTVFAARHGLLRRRLRRVPHAKVQSVRLTPGALETLQGRRRRPGGHGGQPDGDGAAAGRRGGRGATSGAGRPVTDGAARGPTGPLDGLRRREGSGPSHCPHPREPRTHVQASQEAAVRSSVRSMCSVSSCAVRSMTWRAPGTLVDGLETGLGLSLVQGERLSDHVREVLVLHGVHGGRRGRPSACRSQPALDRGARRARPGRRPPRSAR